MLAATHFRADIMADSSSLVSFTVIYDRRFGKDLGSVLEPTFGKSIVDGSKYRLSLKHDSSKFRDKGERIKQRRSPLYVVFEKIETEGLSYFATSCRNEFSRRVHIARKGTISVEILGRSIFATSVYRRSLVFVGPPLTCSRFKSRNLEQNDDMHKIRPSFDVTRAGSKNFQRTAPNPKKKKKKKGFKLLRGTTWCLLEIAW